MAGMRAVMLDAAGTLVHFDDPVGRLHAHLADAGHAAPPDAVAEALRTEVAYFRARLGDARDVPALEALRAACVDVFAAALPHPPPHAVAREALADALRPVLYPEVPDVLAALAGAGVRLAVVSNWDIALGDELAALGVRDRFDAVVVSAEVGAPKPDPAIYRAGLRALGVDAAEALFCGDEPENDVAGPRAVGMAAVQVDRTGGAVGSIPDLTPLVAMAA